jgi:hypothetical protein
MTLIKENEAEIILLVQKKFEMLRKSTEDHIKEIYGMNISLIKNFIEMSSQLKSKRDHSFKYVWEAVDKMIEDSYFDTDHISMVIQGYLNATFTSDDVRVLSGIKKVLDFIGSKEVYPVYD